MPNYCENELIIKGRGGVFACLEAIRGEPDEDGSPRYIDFQKIVPMPAILEGTSSPPDVEGRVLLGDDARGLEMLSWGWVQQAGVTDLDGLRRYIRQRFPDAEEKARRSIQAEQETGCSDWYEWRVGRMENLFRDGHWGTKWNACYFALVDSPTDTRAKIGFCTAWSPPKPVIVELSKQLPGLSFTLKYWECGCGFRGILRVKAGRDLARRDL